MIEQYKNFITKYEMVGSTVVYLNNLGILEEVVTGLKSIENNEITSKNTIYRIASISKVIVAIGVLRLYDEQKIDLDVDIAKYLGFPVRNPMYKDDIITIRMLMTQTSSITDEGYISNGVCYGYDGSNQSDDYIKLKDLLQEDGKNFCNKTFLMAKPGTTFHYSNLGCGILACIVEKVTNMLFTKYIKENLLDLLNIKSGFRIEDIENPQEIASHYVYSNGFKLYRNYELFKKVQCLIYPLGDNYRGVAGGLYISGLDLAKIMKMLMFGGKYNDIRILKETTVKMMEEVQWEGSCSDPTYHKKGLQMIIMDEFTKTPLHGHFGNAYGLRSFMLYNKNGGIIFLCNGANFITDEEHMTTLQKEVIEFLVEKTSL